MFIRIDPSSGMPITRQIAEQIRTQCASGAVAPGDRLPSVRQLAQELAVNQNTILRVYERLTVEGLLERRHVCGRRWHRVSILLDDLGWNRRGRHPLRR